MQCEKAWFAVPYRFGHRLYRLRVFRFQLPIFCNLRWCKDCTGLEGTPNLRKFPLTILCEFVADGVVFRPVLVGTLFAQTQGLHFQAFYPCSFPFICTLHWCKDCAGLEVAPNMGKFPLTAPCKFEADGVVSKPILVGILFAPIQGLHFQALHPLSFLSICTLHWCKHCTGLEVAPNMGKFPLTTLSEIAAEGVLFRPVLVGTQFAPI